MVFYYSATGNSLWTASRIAEATDEGIVSISDEIKNVKKLEYSLQSNEALGFVFPVHAWNPPDTLISFIKKMKINNYGKQYVYALATCGDSSGNTMSVLEKELRKKGIALSSKWEIIMPNNYLPMQDVDGSELEHKKLKQAALDLENIVRKIDSRQADQRLIADRFPFYKTLLVGFFFRKFGKSSTPFYVTDACTSCGLCENICLSGSICLKNGTPVWGKRCDQCYACINRCPQKAIQYGKKTLTRGRYCHPILKSRGKDNSIY